MVDEVELVQHGGGRRCILRIIPHYGVLKVYGTTVRERGIPTISDGGFAYWALLEDGAER